MRAFSFETLPLAFWASASRRVNASLISLSLSATSAIWISSSSSTSFSRFFLAPFRLSISKLMFLSSSSTSTMVAVWLLATMARTRSVFFLVRTLSTMCRSTAASSSSALGWGVSQDDSCLRRSLQLYLVALSTASQLTVMVCPLRLPVSLAGCPGADASALVGANAMATATTMARAAPATIVAMCGTFKRVCTISLLLCYRSRQRVRLYVLS